MRRILPLAIAAALLAAPGSAFAAKPADPALWATVNICDTAAHPDTMGVRASMPGNGTSERLWIRVHAQFRDDATNVYSDLGASARSPWRVLGSARFTRREGGYSFHFAPPPEGRVYTLRARVEYEWRARRRRNGALKTVVVRRATRFTTAGHPGAAGGDPKGFSAAACQLR